jgi:hypothetical protein
MNSFDVGTLLSFFFDPGVGCCCCIPILGFIGSIAGAAHVRKNSMRTFRRGAPHATVAGGAAVTSNSQ